MKRRILSLVLALIMILTMVPTAFAGDKGADALLELLPGNESVTGVFAEILKGIFAGDESLNIEEIKERIDKQYNRPYGSAGYVADENSYYVSLGDSTVTGMNTGDPAYGNYGYKTKVPVSAPYQVAQALGLDVNSQYEQLALAGLRTTDLRFILDETYIADDYTLTRTQERVDLYAGGFEQMRKDYREALQKADLITISIGNCHFTDFISAQLNGAIAEFLNEELAPWLTNKYFGDKVREAVGQYVNLENRTYKMSWEAYIGKEGLLQLQEVLHEAKDRLIEEGIPEIYTVDLADMTEMPIPKGLVVINIPVAELATYMLEVYLYAYSSFAVDHKGTFDKIREIAPEAELLILGMYNPTDKLVLSSGDKQILYGEYYGYVAKALSLYFLDYAEMTPKTTFVDVYGTESFTDAHLEQEGGQYDLEEYLTTFFTNHSDDFHASAAGHVYMKDQILAALTPRAEGLMGDADGSGEVDYVDAMIVLQYHTGIVGDNALDLTVCDVDGSGEVDYVDAMMILQYHTGGIPEFHEHEWVDATCDAPKTCKDCGLTEGSASGHDFKKIFSTDGYNIGSTVIQKCKKCGFVEMYTVGVYDHTVKDTLPSGNGEKARVVFLGGQSNASGCSHDAYLKKNVSPEKYAEYENGYENIYINYFVSGSYRSQGFVKCAARQGESGTCFGPELGLAEKLNELYPDETIFIIKYAWGGTNLFKQWLSPSTSGDSGVLYDEFVVFAEQSIQYLVSKGYQVEIEGMCWMQGESDSFSVENAVNYKVHLSNFIKDIRNQFAPYASPDGIAFIDACIADNPIYWVYCDLVNESKRAVVKESPMNALIDTNAHGLTCNLEPVDQPDMAHYDSLSQLKLGNLFALEIAKFFE